MRANAKNNKYFNELFRWIISEITNNKEVEKSSSVLLYDGEDLFTTDRKGLSSSIKYQYLLGSIEYHLNRKFNFTVNIYSNDIPKELYGFRSFSYKLVGSVYLSGRTIDFVVHVNKPDDDPTMYTFGCEPYLYSGIVSESLLESEEHSLFEDILQRDLLAFANKYASEIKANEEKYTVSLEECLSKINEEKEKTNGVS